MMDTNNKYLSINFTVKYAYLRFINEISTQRICVYTNVLLPNVIGIQVAYY
jgi:hypothetical protein